MSTADYNILGRSLEAELFRGRVGFR